MLKNKVQHALALIDQAVTEHNPRAVFALFSGGDDSLTTALIASLHSRFTGVAHMNTGIGIEETRTFVRETAKRKNWLLREIRAKEDAGQDYEQLVLERGFPSAPMHRKMYNRLKERPLRILIRENKQSFHDRILLVTGIRSEESRIRMGYSKWIQPDGVRVWVNPIHDWTKLDCIEYLTQNNIPRNEVSQMLHFSGECLCGAFAHEGELEEIRLFFPDVAARIDRLQEKVKATGNKRCLWGRRPDGKPNGAKAKGLPGPMCHGCQK